MVANVLWGWLDHTDELWQDITTQVEKLVVKVHQVHPHASRSRTTEEHFKNGQVDWATKIKMSQVDLDWQHKGE